MKNNQPSQLKIGQLYIVATPIGNLDDITLRALATLKSADRIYCEDTRHSKKLLHHFGIDVPLMSLHEHNEDQRVSPVIDQLDNGQSIALISDAGTPLISDPGFAVVRAVRDAGFPVVAIPGPSAVIAALSVAGVATDSFLFIGFLPAKASARRQQLIDLNGELRTVVFYESSHRIKACIKDLQETMPRRQIVLCKELTKQFETVVSGNPAEIWNWLVADPKRENGEFVVILDKLAINEQQKNESVTVTVDQLIHLFHTYLSPSDLAKVLSKLTGQKRQVLYQRCSQR